MFTVHPSESIRQTHNMLKASRRVVKTDIKDHKLAQAPEDIFKSKDHLLLFICSGYWCYPHRQDKSNFGVLTDNL